VDGFCLESRLFLVFVASSVRLFLFRTHETLTYSFSLPALTTFVNALDIEFSHSIRMVHGEGIEPPTYWV
jgi:hypothetical protein